MTRCSRTPTEELVSGVGAISWWFPYEPKRGRHETHETLKNNETQYPQLRQGGVQNIKRKSVWFNAIRLQMFSATVQ